MSSWDCRKCGEVNPCSKTVCRRCHQYRFQPVYHSPFRITSRLYPSRVQEGC